LEGWLAAGVGGTLRFSAEDADERAVELLSDGVGHSNGRSTAVETWRLARFVTYLPAPS